MAPGQNQSIFAGLNTQIYKLYKTKIFAINVSVKISEAYLKMRQENRLDTTLKNYCFTLIPIKITG